MRATVRPVKLAQSRVLKHNSEALRNEPIGVGTLLDFVMLDARLKPIYLATIA